jgi:hypothetical protein
MSSTAYFLSCFKRGVALILRENRSTTTGFAKTPSQSANSILEDWVMLVTIQGKPEFLVPALK